MYMPHMTGMELWDYLQRNQLGDIPVVLMTASPSAAADLLAQGADDYLAKPFDLDQLLDCVARYIPREGASPAQSSMLPFPY